MDNLYFVFIEFINSSYHICFLIIGFVDIISAVYWKRIYNYLTCSSHQIKYPWPLKQGTFNTEFEFIQMVGYGGFGEVYKARNICDKITYAIKKVKLQDDFTLA